MIRLRSCGWSVAVLVCCSALSACHGSSATPTPDTPSGQGVLTATPASLSLQVGQSASISASLSSPAFGALPACSPEATFTSSNPTVISVPGSAGVGAPLNSRTVTAVGVGQAVIKVICGTQEIDISVVITAPPLGAGSLTLNSNWLTSDNMCVVPVSQIPFTFVTDGTGNTTLTISLWSGAFPVTLTGTLTNASFQGSFTATGHPPTVWAPCPGVVTGTVTGTVNGTTGQGSGSIQLRFAGGSATNVTFQLTGKS